MSPDDERRQLLHDLRSPLVVISGFAQLLASDAPIDDATRRDYAARIARAADELQTLVASAAAAQAQLPRAANLAPSPASTTAG